MYIFKITFIPVVMFCWMLVSCSAKEPVATATTATEDTGLLADEHIIVTTAQFEMAKMKLAKAEWRDFPKVISANGRLEVPLNRQAAVSVKMGGYVKNVELIPGQSVRKGQPLFSLENPDFIKMQEAYLEASEKRNYLQADYERQETLASENIASDKNRLKATSDYRVILTTCESLKAQLALINIDAEKLTPQNLVSLVTVRAPISGYLTKVNVVQGMFLAPADIAVEISNTEQLHIALDVFEKDILSIKEGQDILFRLPDIKTSTAFKAKVEHIEQALDLEKRTVHVAGLYRNNNKEDRLLPGMYVDAEIQINADRSIAVPETALVKEDGMTYLLVQTKVDADQLSFEKRAVAVGNSKDGWTSLMDEKVVSSEEMILVEGAFNLIGIE